MLSKPKRDVAYVVVSLSLTLIFYGIFLTHLLERAADNYVAGYNGPMWEGLLYTLAVSVIAYTAVVYQFSLLGNYLRQLRQRIPTEKELEVFYDREDTPSLTVLVPSYKEERMVIWQTMMSSALSEYPHKRVVLLLDDPQSPKTKEDIQLLETARSVAPMLQEEFAQPYEYMASLRTAFLAGNEADFDAEQHKEQIAQAYEYAANWLSHHARDLLENGSESFDEQFFMERVLLEPAKAHRARAVEIRHQEAFSYAEAKRHYHRLQGMFSVEFAYFERKRYVNISHEANKAMNLNSYMALIGKSWREVETPEGLYLIQCAPEDATFHVPAADYVDTIDADTVMTHDFALRLIHFLEQPENSRVAIAQCPISCIPGSPVEIERVAGISIDVHYHVHLGYTHWGGSFWVGANAMLRRSALEAIKEVHYEDGKRITIYIQDRTVIEDTESTIDLVDKGWKLYNYPKRMTFSAMPPDFGSLLIQRRRWANGGLIILPKLISYCLRQKKGLSWCYELFLRFNYLALTTLGAMVTCLMLLYHFAPAMELPMLLIANIPFMLLVMREITYCGYKLSDFLRLMAMNMMLFPVILAGVLKMFQQMITGKKIPFGRTPKVKDRTAAPTIYYVAELGIFLFFSGMLAKHMWEEDWNSAAFASLNVVLFGYALLEFIGLKALKEDLGGALKRNFKRVGGLLSFNGKKVEA